jgi:hypothetical protein
MPAFAVFERPLRNRSPVAQADRFIFLREKFSLAAFVFGPLWMIWRRLWLVLVIYVVLVGAIEFALRRLGISLTARTVVFFLIELLVGLEATSLRRWSLLRRGARDRGIVIADDLEMAERRFFDAKSVSKPAVPPPPPYYPAPGAGRDVLGLFPEPGGGR